MEQVYKKASNCYGCGTCFHVCPVGAIQMEADKEGFVYPKIEQKKCIDCRKCELVCPYIKEIYNSEEIIQEYYAAKHKNEQIVRQSASGGVFTALSDVILKNDGVIYGAAFSEELYIRHERAEKRVQRDTFRGSKYVQSDISGILELVSKDLKDNRFVLFSGTPCQTDGIKQYLSAERVDMEKLILCDFICHGTASPMVWKKYVEFLNHQLGEKIEYYSFRGTDRLGVNFPQIVAGGKNISLKYKNKNSFYKMYVSCYITRPSCYTCNYASYERVSDITLGDFWNIDSVDRQMNDGNGVSSVILNTEKGKEIFDKCRNDLLYLKCSKEDIWQPHLEYPNEEPLKRVEFWKDFQNKNFKEVLSKYGRGNFIGNCKQLFLPTFRRLGIYVWVGKLYKKIFIRSS